MQDLDQIKILKNAIFFLFLQKLKIPPKVYFLDSVLKIKIKYNF